MPTAQAILILLTRMATDAAAVAVAWHLTLLVGLAGLVAGWRPSRRLAGMLLALPLLSAAVLAALYRNPFNAGALGLTSGLLIFRSTRMSPIKVEAGAPMAVVLGAALVAFGWIYPHFLRAGSSWLYLFAAPVGLVPCPSLAVALGFAVATRGLDDRWWSLTLAATGLFYGLFGSIRLGVSIDVALAFGAIALSVQGLRLPRPATPPGHRAKGTVLAHWTSHGHLAHQSQGATTCTIQRSPP